MNGQIYFIIIWLNWWRKGHNIPEECDYKDAAIQCKDRHYDGNSEQNDEDGAEDDNDKEADEDDWHLEITYEKVL